MRDIVIVLGLVALIPMILKRPYIGVLVWTWIAILSPHREAFGFSSALRPNLLIVAVTLIAFVMSNEPKKWPGGKLALSFVVLMVWTTLATLLAPDPATSLQFYGDFVVKMALHMVVLLILINSDHRLISLVWVFALSLGYHAVKIGLVTIYSGGVIGRYTGFGPADTMIDDRNHFAVAMLMLAPILFFLWKHAAHRIMRHASALGMLMCFMAVIGSFSRGGMITMVAMLLFLWTKTRNKLVSGALMAVVAVGAVSFAPAEYKERIGTIFSQGQQSSAFDDREDLDESFCLRLATWQIGWDMTVASPVFGNGLRSIQNDDVAGNYLSERHICADKEKYGVRAAHNIYVEVMTDSGFVGLALFIGILGGAWLQCGQISRRCRGHAELVWAKDLAMMLQVALTAYAVGGVLLSLAYYSGYYLLVCMVIVLGRLVDEKLGNAEPRRVFGRTALRRATAATTPGRRRRPA